MIMPTKLFGSRANSKCICSSCLFLHLMSFCLDGSGYAVEYEYLSHKWLPSHILDKDVLLDA